MRTFPSRNKHIPYLRVYLRRTERELIDEPATLTSTITLAEFSCDLSAIMETVPSPPEDHLYPINRKNVIGSDIGMWDSGTLIHLAIVNLSAFTVNPFIRKSVDNGETWTEWDWLVAQSATVSVSISLTQSYAMSVAKNGVLALGPQNKDSTGKLIGVVYSANNYKTSVGSDWHLRKLISTDSGTTWSFEEMTNLATTGTYSLDISYVPVSGSGAWTNFDEDLRNTAGETLAATFVFGIGTTTPYQSGVNFLHSRNRLAYSKNGTFMPSNPSDFLLYGDMWFAPEENTYDSGLNYGQALRTAIPSDRTNNEYAFIMQSVNGIVDCRLVDSPYIRSGWDATITGGTVTYDAVSGYFRQYYTFRVSGDSSYTRSTMCFAKAFMQPDQARFILSRDNASYGQHLIMGGIRRSTDDADRQDRWDLYYPYPADYRGSDISSTSYSLVVIATSVFRSFKSMNSEVEAAYDEDVDKFYVVHKHTATDGTAAMKVIRSTDGTGRTWEVLKKFGVNCAPNRMNNMVVKHNIIHIATFSGPFLASASYASSGYLRIVCSGSPISSYSAIVIKDG